MFADDAQAARCCRTLLSRLPRLAELWGPDTKPLEGFATFVRRELPVAAPSERSMVGLVLALWNGSGDVPIRELMTLDNANLRMAGSLLAALAEGPAAVDYWLMLHEPTATGGGRLPIDVDREMAELVGLLRDLGDDLHTTAAAVPLLLGFRHLAALYLCDDVVSVAHNLYDWLHVYATDPTTPEAARAELTPLLEGAHAQLGEPISVLEARRKARPEA